MKIPSETFHKERNPAAHRFVLRMETGWDVRSYSVRRSATRGSLCFPCWRGPQRSRGGRVPKPAPRLQTLFCPLPWPIQHPERVLHSTLRCPFLQDDVVENVHVNKSGGFLHLPILQSGPGERLSPGSRGIPGCKNASLSYNTSRGPGGGSFPSLFLPSPRPPPDRQFMNVCNSINSRKIILYLEILRCLF